MTHFPYPEVAELNHEAMLDLGHCIRKFCQG